jgi:hypothetical protein
MNATPRTAARQITVAAAQRAEQQRIARMGGTRLAFTSQTGVVRPVRPERVVPVGDVDDAHCFICGRHTDHFAEHDDMVEAGYAQYEDDGSVTWTEKGWNEYRA